MFTLTNLQGVELHQSPTFKQALEYESTESRTIIKWANRSATCCLDIDDVRYSCGPLLSLLSPTPDVAWISRSGRGIHAIYHNEGSYHADEIAALAALNLHCRYPDIVRFELLKHTFRPEFNQLKTSGPQLVDDAILSRFLGHKVADEDEIAIWLAEHGYVIGNRYPHDKCPANPDARGNRDPVVVYESGIYCHVCQSSGRGWFSFDSLCGHTAPTDLTRMVQHKTHWSHAHHVVASLMPLSESVCEKLYSAAMVQRHGNDVRTHGVFWPKRDILRLGRWWGNESGEIYNDTIAGLISDLPSVQYRDEEGKVKLDRTKVNLLQQTTDLAPYGYASLHPIRGCRIYGHNLSYANRDYTIVLQNPLLKRDEYARYRPRYVKCDTEDIDGAWSILERVFPGVNRNAVRLLIAARGVAEGQLGLPPFLYISGPSGAAKTSSVMIAAAIVGDVNTSIVWKNDMERVRQGIHMAKTKGMYVTINEILKMARKEAVSFQSAMDDILNLTPDSVSHQLYVGQVPLGVLPVCVWTDTEVPSEIRDSIQLARRLVHIHLTQKMEWERPIYESGVGQIDRLRVTSMEYAEACNIILSSVIDDFFTVPTNLQSIAESLGYNVLANESYDEVEQTLRELYETWRDAPALDDRHAKRWRGHGWKLIDLNSMESKLAQIWDAIRDSENPKTSRRCSEANWPKIVGFVGALEFESQCHGSKIVIRFNELKR